jgi:hypothetical protein
MKRVAAGRVQLPACRQRERIYGFVLQADLSSEINRRSTL